MSSSPGGQCEGLARSHRLHTPAFHSYLKIAALLPTDLIITLCTFEKIYGFELLLLITFVILKL